MGNVLGIVTGIGMACGPPLIYVDQAWSIIQKKDSTGFSMDVCAVLIFSNIMRCVFWLGSRFELALLMQSILLILAMLVLLFILLKYRKPASSSAKQSRRPLNFWMWPVYGQYIEFLAAFIVVLCTSYIILGGYSWYIDTLGFIALGLESQLPTPQAISNYHRKSCYGLRSSTLAG
ncbi:hypothetical protein BDY24DRAFT_382022 [Mrakia frigida]|uniref:Any1p n=1 Tax=Mrakia frigida TaxID=29902 RepID=UPI003FCC0266